MIYAHHCILGFYGFWLPNDPRGSGSDYIASWELFRYGPATKTTSRRSVAHQPHDHALRLAAKSALQHPPVELTGEQAVVVAEGFRQAIEEAGYRIHALAILPEHLHAVICWHPREIRLIVSHLRAKATRALRDLGKPPFSRGARTALALQPVWGEHGWNVALDDLKSVDRAVRYVEANPQKEGKPRQHWSLVVPFDLEKVSLDRALADHDRKPLYKNRRVEGAARRSHEAKLERESKLEQYLKSKPDPEDCF